MTKTPTTTPNTVTLEHPIRRADSTIETVTLRCPTAGELRGISLLELMNLNTDAIIKVLPRITAPALAEVELKQMRPADLVQMATEVVSFLVPKAAKESPQA